MSEKTQKSNNTTLTLRLDSKLRRSLDEIASFEKRTRSFVAAQAIADFVAIHEAQIEGIKKAIASADAGNYSSHEDVKAWVESWGTDKELPMPS
jgi:predicted transcriptional regulator